MAQQPGSRSDALVPLQTWIESEAKELYQGRQISSSEETILRKTTIAYGIAELLRHARAHPSALASPLSVREQCNIDNFKVRVSGEVAMQTWNDIKGVDMLSPKLSMNIIEPSFLLNDFAYGGAGQEGRMGRYLEAEFLTFPAADDTATSAVSQSEEDASCHSLGALLHQLFSPLSPLPAEDRLTPDLNNCAMPEKRPHKKKRRILDGGFPASLCVLFQNISECGEDERPDDAYDSLEAVIKDLHLLLLDPNRFLFGHKSTSETGGVQLSFREQKLYGRENEVLLITDAFCRVSTGKSEAFFIGGFSGSGKSMLVNSLTAQVDMAEGFVLTYKFDQMSKERPLLEVISIFNDLCLLIQEKSSPQDLLAIMSELMDAFGTDLSILSRLLPNVYALSHQLDQPPSDEEGSEEGGAQISLRSVCFILQRFMRVVSSKAHPVMIFLDDLQWCDNSALALIEGILCDEIESTCLFFVGSYRNNEVQDNHEIFHLMERLSSFGVMTTKLSLEGLNPGDLNTMISDAMGMFPRICEPLSDIIYQKTKGNPFFVLEFLTSLVDGSLLEYSVQERRWVWNEDHISSMEITDNVLYLLSSKISRLSKNVRLALKVASCFGIKMKGSVVGHLYKNIEYSSIYDGMELVLRAGFMIKDGASDFKFVHDKVREAAYSLIPDSEKNEFHCKLGMTLYSATKGSNVDDLIFSIAPQMNYCIGNSLDQNPELRIELSELNEIAGTKAALCYDYLTARSHLKISLSLLPAGHWKSHYDFSLLLMLRLAKSAYSCGYVEEAYDALQTVLSQAHSLKDKLGAYHLVAMILFDRDAIEDAYITTSEVLLQLGETIPDAFGQEETKEMAKTTSKMLSDLSEQSLLGMKEMDKEIQIILKFYSSISMVAFLAKPSMIPFFCCRMVQLSMKHGICKYSIIGFVQFAAMSCSNMMVANIQGACRIGSLAMAAVKRFNSSTAQLPRLFFIFYGFVAVYSEHVQTCAYYLHRGFECGITNGDTSSGFVNAIHHVRISLIAGIELSTVLKRVDYYLEVMKRYKNVFSETHLLLYRDTILILMGKGSCVNSDEQENSIQFPAELTHYHKGLRAFWMGHSERCHHFTHKLIQGNTSGGRHHRSFFLLYYGLNLFKIIRRTSPHQLKLAPRSSLKALKIAAECSGWNFQNKVHLLEAHISSYEGENERAKASYAAAITSARCSNFIHEQGLANELAGFHYKKIGDSASALRFFHQAKQCYAKWGSQMKVDSMTRQLELFELSMA